jgi:hypothetical protein
MVDVGTARHFQDCFARWRTYCAQSGAVRISLNRRTVGREHAVKCATFRAWCCHSQFSNLDGRKVANSLRRKDLVTRSSVFAKWLATRITCASAQANGHMRKLRRHVMWMVLHLWQGMHRMRRTRAALHRAASSRVRMQVLALCLASWWNTTCRHKRYRYVCSLLHQRAAAMHIRAWRVVVKRREMCDSAQANAQMRALRDVWRCMVHNAYSNKGLGAVRGIVLDVSARDKAVVRRAFIQWARGVSSQDSSMMPMAKSHMHVEACGRDDAVALHMRAWREHVGSENSKKLRDAKQKLVRVQSTHAQLARGLHVLKMEAAAAQRDCAEARRDGTLASVQTVQHIGVIQSSHAVHHMPVSETMLRERAAYSRRMLEVRRREAYVQACMHALIASVIGARGEAEVLRKLMQVRVSHGLHRPCMAFYGRVPEHYLFIAASAVNSQPLQTHMLVQPHHGS